MTTGNGGDAVTVVVSRRVRPGSEAAYEQWLARLTVGASGMPGFLGARLLSRQATEPQVFTSVFRFDSVQTLQAFERSDLRARALQEVVPLVEADAVWNRLTGLELLFAPPPGTVVPQPSRFRMALVMVVVVYGLVLSLGQVVGVVLGDLPAPLRLLVTIVTEVFLMTYVLMPRLTRWLARWIYPRKEST